MTYMHDIVMDTRTLQEVIVSRKTIRHLLECVALHAYFVFMIINPRTHALFLTEYDLYDYNALGARPRVCLLC